MVGGEFDINREHSKNYFQATSFNTVHNILTSLLYGSLPRDSNVNPLTPVTPQQNFLFPELREDMRASYKL